MQEQTSADQKVNPHSALKRQSIRDLAYFTAKVSSAAFAIFLVFFIYSSNLDGPFLFDDGHNIEDNPHVRLIRLSWEGLKRAAFESPLSNRPVAYVSFALNYYFQSYHVVGYRLVNILIHLCAGIFLFLFLQTTLSLPAVSARYKTGRWIAGLATLIWLVHPLHTQSVTYIVQRMNSMAAMFYILSMLLYAKSRLAGSSPSKWLWMAGCVLAGILALGTKETAATLPLFIFLYEWFFFQDLSRSWLKRNLATALIALILLGGLSCLFLDGHPVDQIMAGYQHRNFTPWQRLLTELRVVILYLSLLVYPHPRRLNLDYDFPLSYSLIDPITTLLSLGAILGLLGLAGWLAKKDRLLSFGLFWFFGNLAIESSIIGLEIVFEHRTYLPSMLTFLMVLLLADRCVKSKILKAVTVCSVVMVFSAWTYERNAVWHNEVALWRDTVQKSPGKLRPHNNLGNALKRQGDYEQAIVQFNRALEINPAYAKAHNNLGTALAAQNKTEEAIKHFGIALYLNPEYAAAHSNIGVAFALLGRLDEAIIHFSEALRLAPDNARVHNNLGAALVRRGRLTEALAHFDAALRLKPDDIESFKNLKICLQLIQKNAANSGAASEF